MSNYSIMCNNVIEYAIIGFLKAMKCYIAISCSKERNQFCGTQLGICTSTKKYSHAKNKQNAIDLFKKHWNPKDLLFSSHIYNKLALLDKIDDLSDCFVMSLHFIKTNTSFVALNKFIAFNKFYLLEGLPVFLVSLFRIRIYIII